MSTVNKLVIGARVEGGLPGLEGNYCCDQRWHKRPRGKESINIRWNRLLICRECEVVCVCLVM